jgi:signal transduction histidine kinase
VRVGEPGSLLRLIAEAALAFLAGAALFVLSGLGFPLRHNAVFAAAVGAVLLFVVLMVARHRGPLYGVPVAIAAGVAYDSFYVPPVRALGAGSWENTLMATMFLLVGVAVGVLSSRLQRRAEASERMHAALADEQAALRRVAAQVAREAAPDEVFACVAKEVARLLDMREVAMCRFEHDGTATVVASTAGTEGSFPVGARLGPGWDERAALTSPIVVDGRQWGAMATGSRPSTALPPDAESRIGEFTALVATAISNVQARTELAASRARVLIAADEERRRVVRDLHDGAQQRLVQTILTLKLARDSDGEDLPALVSEALQHAEQATVELRELVHGILPSALAHGGLRAGVDALASRMPVPVRVGVAVDRLPTAVEATAYFVVAEALTNVAKHAHADHAEVTACVEQDTLRLEVRDDGVGGAQPAGSGLVGLEDRLAVLDGQLRVETPPDGGTVVTAAIPLPGG